MRINSRVAVMTGALTLLMAGCGGPPPVHQNTSQSPAVVSAAPVPTPPASKLNDALLTPAELGANYVTSTPSDSPASGLDESLQGCAGESPGPAAENIAKAVYQGGAIGPWVVESITVTSLDQAVQRMHDRTKVIDNCAQFGGSLPGGVKLQIAIDHLTFPRVGDDTVAYRLTTTVPGMGAAIYAHLITVRTANVLILVALMQLTSPEVPATETIVQAAVAKANRVLRTS